MSNKREILFRGKLNPSGNWIEGFLVGNCHIGDWVSCTPVHSKTVGQFTGLTDKNGKKIFEGDIVKLYFQGTSREYAGDFCEYSYEVDFEGHKIGVVTFSGYGTFLKASHGELYVDGEEVKDWNPTRKCRLAAYRSEIIGNIHDNPELLEEGTNV